MALILPNDASQIATSQVFPGDVRTQLDQLPAASVQTIITSPPYWGLRSYLPTDHPGKSQEIGGEQTPTEYIAQLVQVFQTARRVLRPDGTLWVNIGDAYSRGDRTHYAQDGLRGIGSMKNGRIAAAGGFGSGGQADRPAKNLLLLPARFALAMQDAGWILRSAIIWAKPNPLPMPVKDRQTSSYETVFLFVQSNRPRLWAHRDQPYPQAVLRHPAPDYRWIHQETGEERRDPPADVQGWRRINLWRACDYYYDAQAIAEPAVIGDNGSYFDRGKTAHHPVHGTDYRPKNRRSGLRTYERINTIDPLEFRNKRDVWTVGTAGFPGNHFAVFPSALIRPMILAGSRPGDVVLDPFAGSGTTLLTANQLGRHAWGIELNPEYVALIEQRLAGQLIWAM